MAIIKTSLRPLANGKGFATVMIDDDVIQRTTPEQQAAAREYTRKLAQELWYQQEMKAGGTPV